MHSVALGESETLPAEHVTQVSMPCRVCKCRGDGDYVGTGRCNWFEDERYNVAKSNGKTHLSIIVECYQLAHLHVAELPKFTVLALEPFCITVLARLALYAVKFFLQRLHLT